MRLFHSVKNLNVVTRSFSAVSDKLLATAKEQLKNCDVAAARVTLEKVVYELDPTHEDAYFLLGKLIVTNSYPGLAQQEALARLKAQFQKHVFSTEIEAMKTKEPAPSIPKLM